MSRHLKELLGRRHHRLVGRAQRYEKGRFLDRLSRDEVRAIRTRINVAPGQFWRADRGKTFLLLPRRPVQLQLHFTDEP